MNEFNLSQLIDEFINFKHLFDQEKYEIVLNNILGTYLLKKPIFSIKLETTKDKARPFIDFMNTYFFTGFDNNQSNRIIASRFRTFIEVEQQHRELSELLKLLYGHSLTEIFKYCEENKPDLVKLNPSNLSEFMNDLLKFKHFFEPFDYYFLRDITKAYLLEKPLSSIEIYKTTQDIQPFIDCMNKYFFTEVYDFSESEEVFSGEIYFSRIKSFTKIGVKYKKLENEKWGEEECGELADLDGLIYGYTLREIFKYCLKKRPELIK